MAFLSPSLPTKAALPAPARTGLWGSSIKSAMTAVAKPATPQTLNADGSKAFMQLVDNSHMDTLAGSVQTLNRKLWDDYYSNYKGREDQAYDAAFNTDFVGEAQTRATDSMTAANAAGALSAEDMLARYGQSQSEDQQAGTRALTQLGGGANLLAGRNSAKWSAIDTRDALQEEMLNNYMQRVSSGVDNANSVGRAATQRQAEYRIYKAKKKAKRFGALGAIAGLVAAPFTGGASLALTASSLGSMQ